MQGDEMNKWTRTILISSAATAALLPLVVSAQGVTGMSDQSGSIPMMQMVQQRRTLMQEHTQKMEAHMATVEELLRQLVDRQKK